MSDRRQALIKARRFCLIASFFLILWPAGMLAPAQTPDQVLVVVNTRSAESREIGEYYRQRRGIPSSNICTIAYEPYLAYCPRPDYVLPAYYSGRTLAESFYLGIPGLSWMNERGNWRSSHPTEKVEFSAFQIHPRYQ